MLQPMGSELFSEAPHSLRPRRNQLQPLKVGEDAVHELSEPGLALALQALGGEDAGEVVEVASRSVLTRT